MNNNIRMYICLIIFIININNYWDKTIEFITISYNNIMFQQQHLDIYYVVNLAARLHIMPL